MNTSILRIAGYICVVALIACGGKSNDVRDSARESLGGNSESTTIPTSPTDPGTMAASAPSGNVQHYICPKNCAGSGGPSAGTCPVCGSEYVHNQAYHNQSQATTPPTGDQSIQKVTFPGSTTPAAPGSTTAAPPEPAQNAAGVWHYTCPKGCAGGGGSAVACSKCGTTLAHNTAYHQ